MPNLITIYFYVFAAILIYFSLRSLRGGIEYLRFFQEQLAKPHTKYAPLATVIAPCKGEDEGLQRNLSAIAEQDYPNYEIIFVVDDPNDLAVKAIEKIISLRAETKLVIAHKAIRSGQKVENLREGVLHADPRSEVFVFVDSDTRPAKDWLRKLTAPLESGNVGAATGYRWFVPDKMSFGGELCSAWNASIASALGPNTNSNFCWGGSTAVRRDIFERIRMRDRWHGTLSDDFAVTRALSDAGLEIRFVPAALTRSTSACSLRECLDFTTRQIKITRVYMPNLWLMSFFGSGLFTTVMLSAFLIVLLSAQNTPLLLAAIATLTIVSALSIGKAWLRLKAVQMVIPEAERQIIPQLTLWLITPPLFLINCITALFSRRMAWRGISYKMVSEKETLRIR
jgi:cellulose synthase/poly-beta-1,6-N-acetylglucosamine synthase-like glycosyltransferase